ncbi:hypothetical protein VKT23_006560 [Stygiomarasmius scandens]|uniref:Uncharacterized protein n=1 Tax=Marasmiellus scandens TaxID=2682957 RepID=A0ABR1JN79_9AGAR
MPINLMIARVAAFSPTPLAGLDRNLIPQFQLGEQDFKETVWVVEARTPRDYLQASTETECLPIYGIL